MKITEKQLSARLARMSRDELTAFAHAVVYQLYGVYDEETDNFDFDQDKEWEGDTIEGFAEECDSSGITPEKIAAELVAEQR